MAGSINEEGFLHSLGERQGVNKLSSLDELFANAIDAHATTIQCRKEMNGFTIDDDGRGMPYDTFVQMFDMYRLQRRYKTIGNYGIGGKMGMFILSDKQNMHVITLHEGQYRTAYVPWKDILLTHKYSNAITIQPSTPEEIHLFQHRMPRISGTTIWFPPNDDTWEMIREQFDIKNNPHLDPEKSMAYKFGRFDQSILYVDAVYNKTMTLPKYNPSRYVDPRFGRKERQINVYAKQQEYRFIRDDEREIKSKGKIRFECESTPAVLTPAWKRVGTLHVEFYSPFDEHRPLGGSTWYPPHLRDIFLPNAVTETSKVTSMHDTITIFKSSYPVGRVAIERHTSSKRSGFDASCYFNMHTNIHYDTDDGPYMDMLIGIQENKNQLQDILPIPIKRLIDEMRRDYSTQLFQAYMGQAEVEPEPKKRAKKKETAPPKTEVKPKKATVVQPKETTKPDTTVVQPKEPATSYKEIPVIAKRPEKETEVPTNSVIPHARTAIDLLHVQEQQLLSLENVVTSVHEMREKIMEYLTLYGEDEQKMYTLYSFLQL